VAIEDNYKPFWEEKENDDRLKNAAEGIAIQSEINHEIINNVEKESSKPSGSFEEYLIKERVKKRAKEIAQDNSEEDSPEFPLIQIIMFILGVAAVLGVGWLLLSTIQREIAFNQTLNTSLTQNNISSINSFGTIISSQFSFLNPFLTILITGIATMIVFRRSIIPFIITFMMATLGILFLNASMLILLIPGIILVLRVNRVMLT
jgi:hypothetical protein